MAGIPCIEMVTRALGPVAGFAPATGGAGIGIMMPILSAVSL